MTEAMATDTVTDLLAALEGGDRPTEFALVEGRWDHLRDEPGAEALRPWFEAAFVGRLPREQRVEALATRSLPARTWAVALLRPVLPRDLTLVSAWIRHQGIDLTLAAVVRRHFDALEPDPAACDAGYDDLLGAVLHADYDGDHFPDEDLAVFVLDYAAVHERLEKARAGIDDIENTTLRRLVADLDEWGPVVAPQLADCLLDADDIATVHLVADEAGEWTAPGLRAALRRRYATARGAAVYAAVLAVESRQPAMMEGARLFLAEDVKASSLDRIRSARGRRDQARLDAALRTPRAGLGRGLGFRARLR